MKMIININDKIISFGKRLATKRNGVFFLSALLFCFGLLLFSDQLPKPFTFKDGDIISASQMNAEFDTLYGRKIGSLSDVSGATPTLGQVLKFDGAKWAPGPDEGGVTGSCKWADATGGINYNSGNVGIGMTNPVYKLDVAGDINFTGTLRQNGTPFSGGSSQWTASGSNIYYNNGNVGIGTTNPGAKLEVDGQLLITGGNPGAGKVLTSDTTGLASWQNSPGGGDNLGNHIATQNLNLGTYKLVGNGTDGIQVDANGNIGINTAPVDRDPGHPGSPWNKSIDFSSMNGWSSATIFIHSINQSSTCYNGTRGSGVEFYVGTPWDDGLNEHRFAICQNTGNEFSILKNGNIGINSPHPDERFVVFNGSTTGKYTTAGWVHSSDVRLKKNISDLKDSLKKILKIRGVSFNFKTQTDSEQKQIGFIAQEIEKEFPEVVVTDNEGYKSISYGNISAVLVNAVKELKEEKDDAITALKAENEMLKERLAKIEAKLDIR
jgi:hypothetical protein